MMMLIKIIIIIDDNDNDHNNGNKDRTFESFCCARGYSATTPGSLEAKAEGLFRRAGRGVSSEPFGFLCSW